MVRPGCYVHPSTRVLAQITSVLGGTVRGYKKGTRPSLTDTVGYEQARLGWGQAVLILWVYIPPSPTHTFITCLSVSTLVMFLWGGENRDGEYISFFLSFCLKSLQPIYLLT